MLNLINSNQVFLACGSTDCRKSIDGLAAIVHKKFKLDPFSNFCDKLFKIEEKLAKCTAEERYEKRLELAKPILEDFLSWLKKSDALPQSALSKAVKYTLNQWKYLENYLLDGRCELSNNRAERSIKNYLFADTVAGAKSSAMVYSIVETAKENNLNPMKYLTYIFERMLNINFKENPECYINKNS